MTWQSEEQLQRIAGPSCGAYTSEAAEAARYELRRRETLINSGGDQNKIVVEPQPPRTVSAVSFATEDWLAKLCVAIGNRITAINNQMGGALVRVDVPGPLRDLFNRVEAALLPADIPDRLRSLFWLGVSGALPVLYFGVDIARAISQWVITGDPYAMVESLGRRIPYLALWGTTGLMLSYRIWARRTYPKYLALVVVVFSAIAFYADSLIQGMFSTDMVVIGTATFATTRYLLNDPEAAEYFNTTRPTGC